MVGDTSPLLAKVRVGREMRIKCPNCGSTAQVELMYAETDNYGTEFEKEYACDCGCDFVVFFKAVETKILNEE